MQRAAVGVEHRFAHHLRQCRVGEDGGDQFGLGGFQRLGDDEALNELGRLGADQMGAEQRAGLASKMVFTRPSVSPSAIALPLAEYGKRPIFSS